jgi:hypothetical protein
MEEFWRCILVEWDDWDEWERVGKVDWTGEEEADEGAGGLLEGGAAEVGVGRWMTGACSAGSSFEGTGGEDDGSCWDAGEVSSSGEAEEAASTGDGGMTDI